MVSGAAILLTICNYNNFDNFLVSRLYRFSNETEAVEPMVPQGMRDPIDFICDKLPHKCRCC